MRGFEATRLRGYEVSGGGTGTTEHTDEARKDTDGEYCDICTVTDNHIFVGAPIGRPY